jgi:hypothetical protein
MNQVLEAVGVLFDRTPSLVVVVRLQYDYRIFLFVDWTEKFLESLHKSSPVGEAGQPTLRLLLEPSIDLFRRPTLLHERERPMNFLRVTGEVLRGEGEVEDTGI